MDFYGSVLKGAHALREVGYSVIYQTDPSSIISRSQTNTSIVQSKSMGEPNVAFAGAIAIGVVAAAAAVMYAVYRRSYMR